MCSWTLYILTLTWDQDLTLQPLSAVSMFLIQAIGGINPSLP